MRLHATPGPAPPHTASSPPGSPVRVGESGGGGGTGDAAAAGDAGDGEAAKSGPGVPLEMGEAMRRAASSSSTPLAELTRGMGIDMLASVSCTLATSGDSALTAAGDRGVCTGLGELVCSDMAIGLRGPPCTLEGAPWGEAEWWCGEALLAELPLAWWLRAPSCSAYMTLRRWLLCGGNSMPFSCAMAAAAASGVE